MSDGLEGRGEDKAVDSGMKQDEMVERSWPRGSVWRYTRVAHQVRITPAARVDQ